MKRKLFVLALGAFLLVAFCATAMAATKVDFSGTFRVRAHYQNNRTLNSDSSKESKRSWLDQRLRIDFKVMPTENLTLNIGLTTEDTVWGQQGSQNFYSRAYMTTAGTQTALGTAGNTEPSTDFEVRYAWMDIKSPFGLFSIGRMPGSAAGMKTLGWSGSTVMPSGIGDDTLANSRDRISWTLPMDQFILNITYDKIQELDINTGEAALGVNSRKYDQDWDEWSATGIYKFANGGVALTVAYDDIKSQAAKMGTTNGGVSTLNTRFMVPIQAQPFLDPVNPDVDGYYWAFIPSVSLNFGPVGIHSELTYATGQGRWHMPAGTPATTSLTTAQLAALGVTSPVALNNAEVKDTANIQALQFYADVTYNYGPGLVGINYAYSSGDKTTTDYTIDGLADVKADMLTYLIVYDRGLVLTDHLNGDPFKLGGMTNPYRGADHWFVGAWIDHSLTEDLMVHAAYGYFDINNPGHNWWTGKDIDKHFGSEFDVSLVYQIMTNLSLQVDMGYFWGGNYWKQGWDGWTDAQQQAAGIQPYQAKVGNAYLMKNTLTLKF